MVDIAIASGLTVEVKLEGAAKGGKGGGTRTVARLCFDPVLSARAKREYDPVIFTYLMVQQAGHRPRCKIDPWTANIASDTLVFNLIGTPFGTVKYEIVTRSTFGIYQFLGRILAQQREEDIVVRGPLDLTEDPRILGLRRDGGDGCFADVSFQGEFYCIPRRGGENTKRILSLLAQLVALNTSTFDLNITPTVRVQGTP
jgi:hypothetical protein